MARDRYLRNRESLTDLGASSLICAPVMFNDKVLGLIHLYCTDPLKALDGEDLEFAVAVAKQLGAVTHQMQRQASLSAENRSLRQHCMSRVNWWAAARMKDIETADWPSRRHQRHRA